MPDMIFEGGDMLFEDGDMLFEGISEEAESISAAASTTLNYLRLLQSLLPKGRAWNREENSGLTELLYGMADELARIDLRASDLLKERDTRYTTELLEDHELDLGLPDECSDENATIEERRLAAHAKLIALGQQNKAYFIDLAEIFGFTATITEYTPFWSGVGVSGDMAGDQDVIFCWTVTVFYDGTNLVWFTSGSSVSGDPISFLLGLSNLVCIIEKYKPAHTTVFFEYDGPAFSTAFSSAFDALWSSETSYLEGEFWREFSLAFDVNYGAEFERTAYSGDFRKPA